jgi:predicted DNA-binding transcriptional regulator YafY
LGLYFCHHERVTYEPTMRVLTVLDLLQARERVPAAELALALEVSPRSVRRYVTRLQDLGVPVESTHGPGACYRLVPGQRPPPLLLSSGEALAVGVGLLAARHLGVSALAPDIDTVRAKLGRGLPAGPRATLQALDALVLDPPSNLADVDAGAIVQLCLAASAGERVHLRYSARERPPTERDLDPYAVVRHGGRWFVIGHCHLRGQVQTFRLDRILEAKAAAGTFVRPPDFGALAFLHRTLALTPARFEVRVRLGLPLVQASSCVPPALAVLEPDGETATRLHCRVEHLDWFAAWLLELGCPLSIESPPEMRSAFVALATRAQRLAAEGQG